MTGRKKRSRSRESGGSDGPPPPKKAKKSVPESRAARKMAPPPRPVVLTAEERAEWEAEWKDAHEDVEPSPPKKPILASRAARKMAPPPRPVVLTAEERAKFESEEEEEEAAAEEPFEREPAPSPSPQKTRGVKPFKAAKKSAAKLRPMLKPEPKTSSFARKTAAGPPAKTPGVNLMGPPPGFTPRCPDTRYPQYGLSSKEMAQTPEEFIADLMAQDGLLARPTGPAVPAPLVPPAIPRPRHSHERWGPPRPDFPEYPHLGTVERLGPPRPDFPEYPHLRPAGLWPAAARLPPSGRVPASDPDAMDVDIRAHGTRLLEQREPLSDDGLRAFEDMFAEIPPIDLTMNIAQTVPQWVEEQGLALEIPYWRWSNFYVPGEAWLPVPFLDMPPGSEQPHHDSLRNLLEFANIFWRNDAQAHPAKLAEFEREARGTEPKRRQRIEFEILLINPFPSTTLEAEQKDFPVPTDTNLLALLRLWEILECNIPANRDRLRITYCFKNGLRSSLINENPKLIALGDTYNDYYKKAFSTKKIIAPETGIQNIYESAINKALHYWSHHLNNTKFGNLDREDLMNWIIRQTIFSLSPAKRTDRQCGYTKYFLLRALKRKAQTVMAADGATLALRDKSLQRYVEGYGPLEDYLALSNEGYKAEYDIRMEADMFVLPDDDNWDEFLEVHAQEVSDTISDSEGSIS